MELQNEDEEKWIAEYNLLTSKPVIYAANVAEDDLADDGANNSYVQSVREYAKEHNSEVFVICAEIEAEISELEEDEKKMFLEDLGLKESGLEKLIKASYSLLGLISYLTAGETETRAWTIKKGTKAPQAAGKIHSDFERGFIRAEVVNYQDLLDCGSYSAAKEKGLDSVEADYVQGEILFNTEDYLGARQIFEACIDKTEDSYVKMRAYIMTARCIDKMESGTTGTQEKIRLLEEAEQELSGDGNIGVLEELAQAYCDAGAEGDDTYYQKAIEIFKQIEKQGMSDYDTEYNLAVLYQNVGDYSNAAETLDNILKTYGEDYRTYKSLAYLEASKQNSLAVDLRNYSKFGEYYKKADELYQKESASNANDADMERLQELYQQAVDNGWL